MLPLSLNVERPRSACTCGQVRMRCGMVRAQAGAEERGLSPVRTSNVGTSNLGVGVGEEVP